MNSEPISSNDEPLPLVNLRRASYELFVFVLSFIAVLNSMVIVLGLVDEIIAQVVRTINMVLALFFFADFLMRFVRADDKRAYFFRDYGWADLLSGIPFPVFQIFRLFRLVRSAIILRRLGGRKVLREMNRNRAGSALYFAVVLAVILVELASTSIVRVESSSPQANIKTASDAIWWSYVTIATVGYGDYYPVTNQGRVLGILVMTIGVGLFGVLSGFLANAFLGDPRGKLPVESSEGTADAPANVDPENTLQRADLQTLLAQQEATFAELRRRIEAMEAQAQQAGLAADGGGATTPSDAVPPE